MYQKIKIQFDVPRKHIKKIIYSKGVIRDKFNYLEECFRESLGFFLYKNNLQKKRTQYFVKEAYERIFNSTNEEWSRRMTQANSYLEYGNKKFIANGWLLKNIIVQMLDSCFKQLGSENVLEIGSGRGDNLVSLSLKNHELNLTGLEFTKAGLLRGAELSKNPKVIISAIDFKTSSSDTSDCKVDFIKGNALEMPFIDNQFDTVFTTLVFEQIPYDYAKVLKEIRRITSKYAIFVEPFYEANNLRGWLHLKKFDYFRFRYSKFKRLGFEPIVFFTDYPQKANQKSGLLVTKIIK